MKLHPPFAVSARLLPALKIGDAWLSWDGKDFYLDHPVGTSPYITDVIDDYSPGACHGVQECFRDILSFMEAAGDSRKYRERMGYRLDECNDSNEDLFPPYLVDWIVANFDAVQMLECEIEEGELIT